MESDGVVRCCHEHETRVRIVGEACRGLTLVLRATDGEPFVVPDDWVTADAEE